MLRTDSNIHDSTFYPANAWYMTQCTWMFDMYRVAKWYRPFFIVSTSPDWSSMDISYSMPADRLCYVLPRRGCNSFHLLSTPVPAFATTMFDKSVASARGQLLAKRHKGSIKYLPSRLAQGDILIPVRCLAAAECQYQTTKSYNF